MPSFRAGRRSDGRPSSLGESAESTWRAQELVAGVGPESELAERREALARAGAWLGTLPPRLALEQEDAITTISGRCGYSEEAVRRAFQARYWTHPSREQGSDLAVGL